MIDLSNVYAALLSGITTRKNDNEIWWGPNYKTYTIEITDAITHSYIARWYYHDGLLRERCEYVDNKLHGSHIKYNQYNQMTLHSHYCNGDRVVGWWDIKDD